MIIERLTEISSRFGSGNLPIDSAIFVSGVALGVALLALFLCGVQVARVSTRVSKLAQKIDQFPWAGKIERLERSLNELRTEALRSVELTRNQLERAQVQPPSVPVIAAEVAAESIESAIKSTSEATAAATTVEQGGATSLTAAVVSRQAEPQTSGSLTNRMRSTRRGLFDRLKQIFSGKPALDESIVDELRALLIGADLGPRVVEALISSVRGEFSRGQTVGEQEFVRLLKERIQETLSSDLPRPAGIVPARRDDGPLVVLVVGVNGVGKTTTVAKLANQWMSQGARVLLVAADTFRAAAVAQLSEWAERIGAPVVTGAENAKPATVVYEAMQRLTDETFDVVIIDTAGRLQTKANLMQELEGVRNAIQRHQASAPHETILVLDGSTGQNAINQAREFNEAVKLTGLVVTKLDGTPKGGVVVAIKSEFGIPVRYVGVGERVGDLREFDPEQFTEALFDQREDTASDTSSATLSAHGETRRRRRAEAA